MKTTVANYQYKIYCLRIVPLWGSPVYLTDYIRDLTINGHTYKTDTGYEFTGYAAEANMSPGTLDLNGIASIAGISYDKVASGVFDNARVYAFATTWRNPIEDEEPIGVSILGKTTIKDTRYTIQMMMMVDALNQSVGDTYAPSCQKTFGGQEYAGCMVNFTPITVTGTITSSTSPSAFRDSARTEADDYFGEGTISFTTGQNAGLKPQEIKQYVGVKTANITAISKAASAVISFASHPFVVNDVVAISGVAGMTQINGLQGTVTATTSTSITVNIDSSAFSTYTSGGTAATLQGSIVTHEAFHYPIAVGDTYSMIPGCRKRLQDCRDKWVNINNFGGFSFVPTQSTYSQIGNQ
jgi:uncharacterized phage protein (TIGR02218 family)